MGVKTLHETFFHMLPYQLVIYFIQAMEHPAIEYDSRTFGTYLNGILKGCAATNYICNQMNYIYFVSEVKNRTSRAEVFGVTEEYLCNLEMAIHSLSKGLIYEYNQRAKVIGLAFLKYQDFGEVLPALENGYTEHDLNVYRRFADHQIPK